MGGLQWWKMLTDRRNFRAKGNMEWDARRCQASANRNGIYYFVCMYRDHINEKELDITTTIYRQRQHRVSRTAYFKALYS